MNRLLICLLGEINEKTKKLGKWCSVEDSSMSTLGRIRTNFSWHNTENGVERMIFRERSLVKEKQITREFSSQQECLHREVFPNEL